MKIKKAYTLFELLVVISIIGILVSVASISYGAAQKKARDSRRVEDINGIQKAAEMYYSQNSYVYPTGPAVFVSSGVMQQWPTDPKGVGWTAYSYLPGGANTTYCACAAVENTNAGNSNATCTFAASGAYYCVKNQQ